MENKWANQTRGNTEGVGESNEAFKRRVQKYKGSERPIIVDCYHCYGNEHSFFVKGRVYENKGISRASESDSTWRNLVNMYKRFDSDELPNVELAIIGDGFSQNVRTDERGYFSALFDTPPSFWQANNWAEATVRLTDERLADIDVPEATAKIFSPNAKARFGVISDIDDTIMITRADSVLRMVSLTVLNNAHTRLAFRGVTAFYRALKNSYNANNPFFYVSSSPWNLFDFIKDFFDLNRLPVGPFLLRGYESEESKFSANNHLGHKLEEISKILEAYPHLPFVLIGDNGQQDPEIFLEVVKKYQGRILAIYVREVLDGKRKEETDKICKKLAIRGVDMLEFGRTKEAALNAISKGLIQPEVYLERI
jgi:phosphatidate phosphatase APP1